MFDRTAAPLVNILKRVARRDDAPFYLPGHKKGRGAPPELLQWWGSKVFQADLTELPQLDNLAAPEGAIAEAQALAAAAFGARRTWFLVNGSTAGIVAAILATCQTGDKIILPRNAHKSAISGLILAGAIPIFLHPTYDRDWDLPLGISPAGVAGALDAHPDAKAVMVVSPTYQGVCSDIASIAHIAHQRDIPVIIDEAHGAHFTFHPDLPTPALEAGADVAIQSTHKVLGALTQASMLHLAGDRIDEGQLDRALQLVQSSSPSYLLMASLDGARQQMATAGRSLFTQTLQLAQQARTQLSEIPQLSILEKPLSPMPGFFDLDPTRLMVKVTRLGTNGYDIDEMLDDRFGITAELVEGRYLGFAISLGNRLPDIDRLVEGFAALSGESSPSDSEEENDRLVEISPPETSYAPPAMSPREAFFAPLEPVSISRSVGCLSGEIICPYPPGIPVLMPGEAITQTAIDILQQIRDLGGTITGCSDPNLETMQVVRGRSI